MAFKTEETYIGWLRRFARFHEDTRMDLLGEEALKQFLSYIAVEEGGLCGHAVPGAQCGGLLFTGSA